MREQFPDYPLLVIRYEDMLQVTYAYIFRKKKESETSKSYK